ncbi:hypothetical protein GCM10029964_058440 [Kibdelosporangium lantanae]
MHRGRLKTHKAAVRVQELREIVGKAPGTVGIAHTRWATHGEVTDVNAHPHTDATGRFAVVHNGIVENADELRSKLTASGVTLVSETDTEALAHMIAAAAEQHESLEDAVRATLRGVEGTYGLVVLDARRPGELVVARNGSPIVLGVGEGEMFVASDVSALVRHTQRVVYLEDGEIATVRAADFHTTGRAETVELTDEDYELGEFTDFMRKEMAEQPEAVRRALRGRLDTRFATARLGGLRLDPRDLREVRRVKFLGCGTAYYAGQIGANLVEELARIPADAEPASEFRYRNPVVDSDTLYVAISQSGETLDTLAAVQELKRKGGNVIGAVNVVGSAVARECGSGCSCTPGRRCRSRRRRRSPTWWCRSRCWRCGWAGSGTCPWRTDPGWCRRCRRCPTRSTRSCGPTRRSRTWPGSTPTPGTCSSSAGCGVGRWRGRARRSSRRSPTCTPRRTRRRS